MNGCSEFLPKVLNKMSALYLMPVPGRVPAEGKEAKEMDRYVVVWNVIRGQDGLLGAEVVTTSNILRAMELKKKHEGVILEKETIDELIQKLQEAKKELEG